MTIAARCRPPVLMSCALLALCWLAAAPPAPRAPVAAVAPGHPPVIAIEATAARDVIAPPAFADAAAWPRGIMIAPPATADAMTIRPPVAGVVDRVVDRVLAAVLEPLLAARS